MEDKLIGVLIVDDEQLVRSGLKVIIDWNEDGFQIIGEAGNGEDALQKIRDERRKELLMRGLRWADLKRYNRDGANVSLTRVVNGVTYVLPPNDPRYAIVIPEDIIKMTGMPQNER